MTIAANPPGASDVRPGRLDEATLKGNFADLHPLLTPTRRGSRPSAAISASTRPASRPARPRSTFRCSFARSPPATARARRRRFSMPTSWAACARASARPRRSARKPACARRRRAKPVVIGLIAALRDRCARSRTGNRLTPRRADRQAGRDRRRGAGGVGLRARARRRRRREHDLRAAREGGRPQRIRHRRLQDRRRFRGAGSRVHSLDRRHRGQARPGARPRRQARRSAARLRRGVPRRGPRRDQQARIAEGDRTRQRDRRGRLHRRAAAGEGSVHAAGRPARRGDRRRHDGDRRRRAIEEARRRDRDHRLSARAASR